MTPEQLHRLRTLLAGKMLFPEARALAELMLRIATRRTPLGA